MLGLCMKNVDFITPKTFGWLTKITNTDGDEFYLVTRFKDNTFYMWIYFFGCPDDTKNFSCTLSFKSKSGDEFVYHGPVHTLDKGEDDVVASGSFFAIPINAVKFSLDEKKSIQVEVTIRNLKKEAMDDDMSSGASEGEQIEHDE